MSTPDWEIVGHRRVISLLQRSIAGQHVSHAYLLSGPRQTGKSTMALAFAKALNCAQSPAICGVCRSCAAITRGNHPDVRVLRLGDPSVSTRRRNSKSRSTVIHIDDIRAMLRDSALTPYEGRWKVYIVSYAEHLKDEAIETMLKTLEEPPERVVLTLTTADAKILRPTVISRCQQLGMGPVPAVEIATALQTRYGLPADRARLLAHLSQGRVGWAIEAARDAGVVETRSERLSAFVRLVQAGRFERMAHAEQLASEFVREPESTIAALELWLGWWRDLVLMKHGIAERVVNCDRERELAEHSRGYGVADLVGAMQAIKNALLQLQQNVNPRLALEAMMLSFPVGAR